ncbi:hypothetical protein GCM10010279_65540 [Streptomyces mutabilis]|nr:hypothetical protein GCM10010279_65540 [Streptomyces mutabilis]
MHVGYGRPDPVGSLFALPLTEGLQENYKTNSPVLKSGLGRSDATHRPSGGLGLDGDAGLSESKTGKAVCSQSPSAEHNSPGLGRTTLHGNPKRAARKDVDAARAVTAGRLEAGSSPAAACLGSGMKGPYRSPESEELGDRKTGCTVLSGLVLRHVDSGDGAQVPSHH